MNALAQGAIRQFTQWLWIEHPTFQFRGGHFTAELLPPPSSSLENNGRGNGTEQQTTTVPPNSEADNHVSSMISEDV